MAIPLTINGTTYNFPSQFDKNWAPVVDAWATAVTNGLLQTSGINAVTFLKSATLNPAATGFLRLAKTDVISWRNVTNGADLPLGINGSNQLTFNGTPIGASSSLTDAHIFVGNGSNQPADVAMSGDTTISDTGVVTIANGAITNSKVAAAAAIAYTKLAVLNTNIVPVSDGSGFLTSSTTTTTEIGYVHGVTSAIQTQLNTLTTNQANYLPLTGGTMSGTLNVGSNKIISLANGSNTGDAVNFGQLQYLQSAIQVITTTTTVTTSTSFGTTHIDAFITPTSASSRIKISVNFTLQVDSGAAGGSAIWTLARNASGLGDATNGFGFITQTTAGQNNVQTVGFQYIDSPATTNSTEYTVYIRVNSGGGTTARAVIGSAPATIILEEIR